MQAEIPTLEDIEAELIRFCDWQKKNNGWAKAFVVQSEHEDGDYELWAVPFPNILDAASIRLKDESDAKRLAEVVNSRMRKEKS